MLLLAISLATLQASRQSVPAAVLLLAAAAAAAAVAVAGAELAVAASMMPFLQCWRLRKRLSGFA